MLGASYWFYAAWDRRFVLLIAAMTLVNAGSASLASRAHHSGRHSAAAAAVGAGIGFDLAVLGFFKYYGFFTESLETNLGIASPALSIVLPVGISFFTFQAISYVIDVHRGVTKVASLLDFAVYLSFFPQLVAGPIVRAREFMPQMRFGARTPRRQRRSSSRNPEQLALWRDTKLSIPYSDPGYRIELGRAAHLIGRGMFKKVVVADFLAGAIVEEAFASPGAYSALDVLFGMYGYAVQIYADFSGYTDMAIGVALLMGFRFPQNFDRPYAAVSIQDFWRRWHMTLSRWLRDYLYIPLGGNRRGRVRTYLNLLITMGLGGLWHGASGVFIVWGLYHGAGLAAERFASRVLTARKQGKQPKEPKQDTLDVPIDTDPPNGEGSGDPRLRDTVLLWIRVVLVFHFVCVGWVLFNSDTLASAGDVFGRLAQGWATSPVLLTPTIVAVIVGSILLQLVPTSVTANLRDRLATAPAPVVAAGFALWIMIVVAFGPEGVADYIYFQF